MVESNLFRYRRTIYLLALLELLVQVKQSAYLGLHDVMFNEMEGIRISLDG